MAEYIDCERTCKDCLHFPVCYLIEHYGADEDELCEDFKAAADVVEVVRCKDCVYASRDGYICRYSVGRVTSPDDYCKNGVAKMDGKGEGE